MSENQKFFDENLETWLKDPKYFGKYLVIKDAKILGTYPYIRQAYNETIKKYPHGTFTIKPCIDKSASILHMGMA